MTAGLVWQFTLVLILVDREQRTLKWSVVRDVLWLRAPPQPQDRPTRGRIWLVVPIVVVAFALEEFLPFEIAPAAGRDGRPSRKIRFDDRGRVVLASALG